MRRRILLVDDDLPVLLTLKALLEFHGFEVETASTTSEARNRIESAAFHLVITDLRMDSEDAGLEVIRAARSQTYDPAIALLTAYPTPGNGVQAEHADSILVKPLGTKDLLRQLEALLVRHEDAKQARLSANAGQHSVRRAS